MTNSTNSNRTKKKINKKKK